MSSFPDFKTKGFCSSSAGILFDQGMEKGWRRGLITITNINDVNSIITKSSKTSPTKSLTSTSKPLTKSTTTTKPNLQHHHQHNWMWRSAGVGRLCTSTTCKQITGFTFQSLNNLLLDVYEEDDDDDHRQGQVLVHSQHIVGLGDLVDRVARSQRSAQSHITTIAAWRGRETIKQW